MREEPLELFAALARDDRDLAHCSFARSDLFLVGSPDLIHEVLVAHADRYARSNGVYKRWRRQPPLLGARAGFLPQEHPAAHVRARRVYAPGFSRARLDAAFPLLSGIAGRALDNWSPGERIDGLHEMRLLAVRMLTTVAFGRELSLPATDVVAHVRRGLAFTSPESSTATRELARYLRWRSLARMSTAYDALAASVAELVREHRDGGLVGEQPFVHLLREAARAGDLDDDVILYEALGFLFAGVETTAMSLAWILYWLGERPDAQERIRAEHGGVPADTLLGAKEAPFTYAVFSEALRLTPPAPSITRVALVEHELGGRRIPLGATLVVSPLLVHRDPRWYEEPDRFRPERWLDGSLAGNPQHAYIPFSAGRRKCLGEQLAWREFAAVVPAVVRRFELALSGPEPIHPAVEAMLQPHVLPLVVKAAG